MALPTWPAGVPLTLRADGFSQEHGEELAVTDFEDGAPRQRKKSLSDSMVIGASIRMTKAQFATFETWHRTTLDRGASRFTATIDRPTGTSASKEILIVDGGRYTPDISGQDVIVNMSLRIWDYYS